MIPEKPPGQSAVIFKILIIKLSFPFVGHLVRRAKAFRWRSGRQRHPGVQSGAATRLGTDDQLPGAPLPDGLRTVRAERVRTEIKRGEEPVGGLTLAGAGQEEGTDRQRGTPAASRCRQTGPRTPTD